MNKINYFFPAYESIETNSEKKSAAVVLVKVDNIPEFKLELVANLILDGLPNQYQTRVSIPTKSLIDKQPLPKYLDVVDIGSNLINLTIKSEITLYDLKPGERFTFIFELFKDDGDYSRSETVFSFV